MATFLESHSRIIDEVRAAHETANLMEKESTCPCDSHFAQQIRVRLEDLLVDLDCVG